MADDPTLHQSFLGFPRLNTPFVNEDRTVALVWGRFLDGLYLRAGGSNLANPNTVYISQAPVGVGAPLAVYNALDGTLIGILYLQNTGGGPAMVEIPGLSPFGLVTALDGTLIVSSGKVEISRDAGATWFVSSLVGGALPMLKNDHARVSWTQAVPQITFLPIKYSA